MKTVIFPSTYIEPRWAEQMASIWGPVTLLQPSGDLMPPETRRLVDSGVIEALYPSALSEDLPAVLEAFEHWAVQHSGSDLGALLRQGRDIPFFDSQSSAQLVAELRRGDPRPAESPAADIRRSMVNACLFLCMAQKFDRQQAELARDIEALAARESEMLALLKGEAVDGGPPASAWRVASPGDAMLDRRLKSWARAMTATGFAVGEGAAPEADILFLTDSPEVMALVRERLPEMVPRLRSAVPTRKSPLVDEALPAWLQGPSPRGCATQARAPEARFDLDELPGTSPAAFPARLVGGHPSAASSSPGGPSGMSTWVGCMTPLRRHR